MRKPGWYTSPDSPSKQKWWNGWEWTSPTRRRSHWLVDIILGAGILAAIIGASMQMPYAFGERAEYVVAEGEIVEQSKERTSTPRGGIRPDRQGILCKAKVAFVVNGSSYVNKAEDLLNKCDLINGQKIQIAYHPDDVTGKFTTRVYKYNLNPYAITLLVVGVGTAATAWIAPLTSYSFRYKKRRRR